MINYQSLFLILLLLETILGYRIGFLSATWIPGVDGAVFKQQYKVC